MNVNFYLSPEEEYVWRVAKAHAKAEKISVSALVVKAILLYCSRNK